MRKDLGHTTSIDVITGLVSLAGQSVIDIGCGDMTFSRQLARAGASVLAVDPDPVQAELNRAADETRGLAFIEATAEDLPVRDAAIDGVFFTNSLHHVSASDYPDAFAEVFRSLKPDGFLCVIEPVHGTLNEVTSLFHDEDRELAAAQCALRDLAIPAFESHAVFLYHSELEYESFDAFVEQYSRRSYNSGYTEGDIRRPEIEQAFERVGRPAYRFVSSKQLMFLEGVKAPSTTGS